jgi:hypothetical protein
MPETEDATPSPNRYHRYEQPFEESPWRSVARVLMLSATICLLVGTHANPTLRAVMGAVAGLLVGGVVVIAVVALVRWIRARRAHAAKRKHAFDHHLRSK